MNKKKKYKRIKNKLKKLKLDKNSEPIKKSGGSWLKSLDKKDRRAFIAGHIKNKKAEDIQRKEIEGNIRRAEMRKNNLQIKQNHYRDLFYKEWGTYDNYLKSKISKPKKPKAKDRDLYFVVRGDAVWYSPVGNEKEFFLTRSRITKRILKKTEDYLTNNLLGI